MMRLAEEFRVIGGDGVDETLDLAAVPAFEILAILAE
jgi:hypothetical protein